MKSAVNLFWTGGWDSTFELLDLTLRLKRPVKPFYLLDGDRKSTDAEILTIKRITKYLHERYPFTHELIKPVKYFEVDDIPPDKEVEEVFTQLRQENHLGMQYNWLARFCRWQDIDEIELCIINDGNVHHAIEDGLKKVTTPSRKYYEIDEEYQNSEIYTLFGSYTFPILELNKAQIHEISKEQGWNQIMLKTSFCFNPSEDLTPCGACNPCKYAIEGGVGWRIPLNRRITGRIRRLTRDAIISSKKFLRV